jgi:hypothetical protein
MRHFFKNHETHMFMEAETWMNINPLNVGCIKPIKNKFYTDENRSAL